MPSPSGARANAPARSSSTTTTTTVKAPVAAATVKPNPPPPPTAGGSTVTLPPLSPRGSTKVNSTAKPTSPTTTANSARQPTLTKPLPPVDPKPTTARGRSSVAPATATAQRRGGSRGGARASVAKPPGAKLTPKELRKAEEARRVAAAIKIQQWIRRRVNRLDWRRVVAAAREYAILEERRQQERIQFAKRVLRRFLRYASWRIRIVKRERLFQRQVAAAAKVQRCLWGIASEALTQRLRFARLTKAALVIMRRWKESAMFAKVRWRKANDSMRALLESESFVERRDIERAQRQEWIAEIVMRFRKAPAMARYRDAVALERLEDAAVYADRERKMVLRGGDGMGGPGGKNRLSRGMSRMHRAGSSPNGASPRISAGGLGGLDGDDGDFGSLRWTRRLGDRLQAANRSNSLTPAGAKLPRRQVSTSGASGSVGGDGGPRIRFNASATETNAALNMTTSSPGETNQVSRPSTRGDSKDVTTSRLGESHQELLESLEDGLVSLEAVPGGDGFTADDPPTPHSPLAVATAGAADPFSLDWLINAPLPPQRASVGISEGAVARKQGASIGALGGWYPWIRSTDYNRLAAGLQIADDTADLVGSTHVARLVNDHAVERLLLQEHLRRQRLSSQFFSLTQGLHNELSDVVRAAEQARAMQGSPQM